MKYLHILLLSVFFTNCSSVPKEYVVNDTICHYNEPIFKINKEELVLNPNILKQSKDENGDIVISDNENYKNLFSVLSSGSIANYQTSKQLGIDKWILYRKNRTIKRVSFVYINGTKPIFKETHYNEQGKITKVIDYEKGYKICWAEAIEIVKRIAKKDIEKYHVTEFYAVHNNLNQGSVNKKPIWFIGFLKGNEKHEDKRNRKGTVRYLIDGVTGELLDKYRIKSGF